MDKSHRYQLMLRWSGGAKAPAADYASYSREYRVEVPGKPALLGSADPSFRGDASLHNPEELLLAALSACHMLSYLALCVRSRIPVVSYEDAASGVMSEIAPHKIGFTEVMLKPRVVIAAGADAEKAKALHHQAHDICFIANSVNFPVRNKPEISAAAG